MHYKAQAPEAATRHSEQEASAADHNTSAPRQSSVAVATGHNIHFSFCLKKSVYMGTDAGLWTGGRLQGPELQPLRSEQPHRNVCAPDPFAPHQSITAAAAAAWRHAESHLLLLVTQVPSRPNVSDSWRGLRAEEVRGIQVSSLSVNNSRGGREGWREGWRVEGGRRLRPRGSTRDAVSRDKVCETDARGIQRASLHSVIAILS